MASDRVEIVLDPLDHLSTGPHIRITDPQDFQAMLPPSCHFCCTSPLQGSRNGLSFPGSDARHFPDTLKRKSYPKHLWFKLNPSPMFDWAPIPPHPGLVTPQSMAPHLDEKRLNISSFRISLTSFTGLVPLAASRQLSSLMIWKRRDGLWVKWREVNSYQLLACCLFVIAKTWFPPKPWQ